MKSFIWNIDSAVALLLVALTLASWTLGVNHGFTDDPDIASTSLLAISFFKVRLVIRYFMESRHAPAILRWCCEAYVLASFVLIVGFTTGLFT